MGWPKGMKRKRIIRPDEGIAPVQVAQAEEVAVVKKEAVVEVAVKKGSKFQPYLGKGSLPNYSMHGGRVVPGESRFALVRASGRKYKLLAYKRTPSGVERTLARVIEPSNNKFPQDRALFDVLKKAGIPGAY